MVKEESMFFGSWSMKVGKMWFQEANGGKVLVLGSRFFYVGLFLFLWYYKRWQTMVSGSKWRLANDGFGEANGGKVLVLNVFI